MTTVDEFSGPETAKVDDRGRVAIPASFMPTLRQRADVGADGDGLEVILGIGEGRGLCIYTKPDHHAMLERLARMGEQDRDFALLRKTALQTREVQKLDTQNRVRIPQLFSKKYGLAGEIVIFGSGDHLEVKSFDSASGQLDRCDEIADRKFM